MNTNGKKSVIFASLALPFTVLIGSMVNWLYKSSNPDKVDITAGLAYLRPILLSTFITFAAVMVLALVFAIRGRRKDASPELSYLGLTLAVVITLVSIAGAIALSGAGNAEDAYREERTRQFFEAADQQER